MSDPIAVASSPPPPVPLPVDFADPWEHVRLLSDRSRNDAMLRMLALRAPGNRVLEVGCGTGLLACVAAKLGATRVFAVESTRIVERARAFVADNKLADVVTVLEGRVEDVPAEPVDLAFSELLNADPFLEGVASAMDAAARWVVPGGRLSPRRLKVYVALAWNSEPYREWDAANGEVARMCVDHGLRPDALHRALDVWHPARIVTHAERAVSTIGCAIDVPLGQGAPMPDQARVAVWSRVEGEIGGAIVWFSAELDDDLWMSNPPGAGTHWGQMVCGWPRPINVKAGDKVMLEVCRLGTELVVVPAD